MVNEAKAVREEPSKFDFFPSARDALGVEPSLYLSQYPHTYYSYTKEGYPLFFSKPGVLNINSLECITSIQGILNYHWHDMMHNYQSWLRQTTNKRYECVLVLDLDHLTSSQLSKRAMNIMKIQTSIDSLCFPETLHRMLIINAPAFFTMTWKVVKNWVDIRTSNKVELYGKNSAIWKARLQQLVDPHNLPQDYAGTNISVDDFILQQTNNSTLTAQLPHLMRLRGHSTVCRTFTLKLQEFFNVSVFTRSLNPAILHIVYCNGTNKKLLSQQIRHNGEGKEEEESPTRLDLTLPSSSCLPGTYKIILESRSNHLFQTNNFFVVTFIHPITSTTININKCESSPITQASCEIKDNDEQSHKSLSDIDNRNELEPILHISETSESPDNTDQLMTAHPDQEEKEDKGEQDEDETLINIYKNGGIKYVIENEDTTANNASSEILCGGFFCASSLDFFANICHSSPNKK